MGTSPMKGPSLLSKDASVRGLPLPSPSPRQPLPPALPPGDTSHVGVSFERHVQSLPFGVGMAGRYYTANLF